MAPATSSPTNLRCPCLSGSEYDECCAPFHRGEATAPTAERLMRSRYTAYALGLPEYLLATWHTSTRPRSLVLDPAVEWVRLDILGRERGGMLDTEGTVEFEAHYRSGAQRGSQREVSRFRRDGSWCYVDGT